MPKPTACPIREHLVKELEDLLHTHAQLLTSIMTTQTLEEAEKAAEAARQACIAAREALHQHDHEHACQPAFARAAH